MPKTMASKSMAKVARMIRRSIAKRRPSRIDCRLGRAAPGWGGIGAIRRSAARLATKVATSRAKAVATPATAMRMPAKMDPATETVWPLSQLTAMAAGKRSRGTRRGRADVRAGWSTDPTPAATNATT